MREVISTVYEFADLGVTIVPVKSQTGRSTPQWVGCSGPSKPGTAKWRTRSSENVRLGQARARAQGREIGRPRKVGNDMEQRILTLRSNGHGYKVISQRTGVARSTVRHILKGTETMLKTQALTPAPSIAADTILRGAISACLWTPQHAQRIQAVETRSAFLSRSLKWTE